MNSAVSRFPLLQRVARPALLASGAMLLAATTLTGCGLFGENWDVKLEVTGTGQADIGYNFSGQNHQTTVADGSLPWTVSQNVGFGFNGVAVLHAQPGTACRIYVDGKLRESQDKPDSQGTVSCNVNLQEE
ncbi:MmpS family transport accessory protein [Streptomyces kutzneri]|uniref:MmpS family transport accessory protein n=1 Tax=Streptomyces kutzneri TaxID=3051179 RepID=UPI0028D8397A|nr:MmpS family transport accessory protein [Streptomyces sp. DSM 40907]